MKITLGNLAGSFLSLLKLSDLDLGDPITNFKFMGVVATAETEIKKYDKVRIGIIKKHGGVNDGSNNYFIPPEKRAVCNKEIDKLDAGEIEMDWDIISCPIEALKGFTANDMKCLNGKFINIKGD